MWNEGKSESGDAKGGESATLYGNFSSTQWQEGLSIPSGKVPHALIVHGDYEPTENLRRWERLLGPEAVRPQWNVVVGKHEGRRVGFANVIGGPMAAMAVHPCCVMGAELVVQTGYFGGLSQEVGYGDVLIVDSVRAGCGVAEEYAPGQVRFDADPKFVEAARLYCERNRWPHVVGEVRSTDAIFRETRQMVEKWEDDGQIGIDMESSATFAVASTFERPTIGLLNLSDHLLRGDHLMNYDDERLELQQRVDERIRELTLHLVSESGEDRKTAESLESE